MSDGPAGWTRFEHAPGDGWMVTLHDAVTVRVWDATGSRPAEVGIATAGRPLDAVETIWLAGRLAEAARVVDVVAFEVLAAGTASDAVRAVEHHIDAHILPGSCLELDGDQGPSVVRALLALGWRPPLPALVPGP